MKGGIMSQKNLVDKIAKAILFRRSIARLISGLIDYPSLIHI